MAGGLTKEPAHGQGLSRIGEAAVGVGNKISLDTDEDTYIVSDTDDTIQLFAGGTEITEFDADGVNLTVAAYFANGSESAPGISFGNDPDSGFWRGVADTINLSVGASEIVEFDATSVDFTPVLGLAAGTYLLPSLTRTGDLDTGFWFSAPNTINASVGAAEVLEIDATEFTVDLPTLDVENSSTGPVTIRVENKETGAETGAHAKVEIISGDDSAGDPYIHFRVGGVLSMSMGLDNSASDVLTWSNASSLGSNDRMKLIPGSGILSVDGDGGGSDDPVSLFDDYDDAMALRAFQLSSPDIDQTGLITLEQREANREMLYEMGVTEYSKQSEGPDHMMIRIQPMLRLLAGGIYQNRSKLDELETENRQLRALVEAK